MKLITEVKDDARFLSKLYKSARRVEKLVKVTGIMEIRKRLPEFTGSETEEERDEKTREQGMKNFLDMAEALLEEHPEETVALVHELVVLDEEEDYPHGFELLDVIAKVFTDKGVWNFFQSCMSLGIKISNLR